MNGERSPSERDVIVIGAGPVGMSVALALDARGVPVNILEAESADRDRPGSRADYVHRSTLEILESVHPGLGQRIAEAGLVCPTRKTLWRGREVYAQTFSASGNTGELPHHSRIPQTVVEDFLLEAIKERDIDIIWDAKVKEVDSATDGVQIITDDGQKFAAAYAIGADGGSSSVRHAMDIEMSGVESENTFLIVDVDERPDDPLPVELTFHYGHPDLDDRNVLMAPFAGGWRIDLTCRASDDHYEITGEEFVSRLVSATVGAQYTDRVSWVSTYNFKQVTADRFVDEHHRVLLAGDAAHLFAPFGGRGMNSGIHDADAAASAIAGALSAETDAVRITEIENYARLREKAAEWNTFAAGKALEHIHSDRLKPNIKKRVAAELSRWWTPAARWLDRAHFGPHAGPPIPTKGKF